jgi:hypothetical protein
LKKGSHRLVNISSVVYDPQSDKYLLPQAALALSPALIEDLPTDGWEQFEGWER